MFYYSKTDTIFEFYGSNTLRVALAILAKFGINKEMGIFLNNGQVIQGLSVQGKGIYKILSLNLKNLNQWRGVSSKAVFF